MSLLSRVLPSGIREFRLADASPWLVSPSFVVVCCVAFFVGSYALEHHMRHRTRPVPLPMTTLARMHNASFALFSALLFVAGVVFFVLDPAHHTGVAIADQVSSSASFEPPTPHGHRPRTPLPLSAVVESFFALCAAPTHPAWLYTGPVAWLLYAFYLSKVWEYLDIILVVLGKPVGVATPRLALHFRVHHSITLAMAFASLAGGLGCRLPVFFANTAHHAIMYAHFAGFSRFSFMLPITGTIQLVIGLGCSSTAVWQRVVWSAGCTHAKVSAELFSLSMYALLLVFWGHELLVLRRMRREAKALLKAQRALTPTSMPASASASAPAPVSVPAPMPPAAPAAAVAASAASQLDGRPKQA